ncbi:MAG: hypothetical protein FD176_297 [Rhodospirillaceae bacterium]|nr:MAG: hypothetical protein FD176_297 [Rhodospirillaceae bacterium]TNC97454.1 MAG: transketolase [Stygiobacter sp.]
MRKVCLNMVHELARQDERVLYLGSDPGPGTLDAMRKEFPQRHLIEGIAEANVVGMAAGLAMEGFIPYVNTISTFLTRRCFEQVAIDLCLHNLPVRLIGNGGGFVYAPLGPTHTAIEDIALMRSLPNMAVVVVTDAEEMARMMPQTLNWPGPMYIRLAKGGDTVVSRPELGFTLGKPIVMAPPGDAVIFACGVMVERALKVAANLAADGIACGVVNLHTIKPLDETALVELAAPARLVVTLEEHSRNGGLGSAVFETLQDNGVLRPGLRLGIPDKFTHHYGSQNALLAHYRLDADSVAADIRAALNRL